MPKSTTHDDAIYIEMLRDILEKAGYKVTSKQTNYRCFNGRTKKQKEFINWLQKLILRPEEKVF